MKKLLLLALTILCVVPFARAQRNSGIANPAIDMPGYLRVAAEAAEHRESRRLTEADFIRLSREPGTVILDARSREKYNELHIKGAKHLSFSEITAQELAKIFPKKSTRILIYCNNNFLNAPDTFAAKAAAASLNIHTFNTLHNYGYTNVYELGPLIEIRKAKLKFEGTQSGAGSHVNSRGCP